MTSAIQIPAMLTSVFAAYILACTGALAKPEQIRAVQDPIYHFYLQSYPKNGKFTARSYAQGRTVGKTK